MDRTIQIPITGEDNLVLTANHIVTCIRTAATTTDVIILGGFGQTANLNLQLTHAADTVTDSVAKSIMDAKNEVNGNNFRPNVTLVMTPATAVSAVAVA